MKTENEKPGKPEKTGQKNRKRKRLLSQRKSGQNILKHS
jgi:hypothetical protein